MDLYNIKKVLEDVKTKDYDKVIMCLSNGDGLIIHKGDRVNFNIETDFLDWISKEGTLHYVNPEHVVDIMVELNGEKDNDDGMEDDLDNYHDDLEVGYDDLLKKINPDKQDVTIPSITYPNQPIVRPPNVWYLIPH